MAKGKRVDLKVLVAPYRRNLYQFTCHEACKFSSTAPQIRTAAMAFRTHWRVSHIAIKVKMEEAA